MKCPTCQTELKRILYGGVPVFRCFSCAGFLVQEKRFEGILRSEEAPVDLLKHEVATELKLDTTEKLKCPRCCYPMLKLELDPPASITIDVCSDSKCGHLWLDGGELAKAQLAHKTLQTEKTGTLTRRIRELRGECLGTHLKSLPKSSYLNDV